MDNEESNDLLREIVISWSQSNSLRRKVAWWTVVHSAVIRKHAGRTRVSVSAGLVGALCVIGVLDYSLFSLILAVLSFAYIVEAGILVRMPVLR